MKSLFFRMLPVPSPPRAAPLPAENEASACFDNVMANVSAEAAPNTADDDDEGAPTNKAVTPLPMNQSPPHQVKKSRPFFSKGSKDSNVPPACNGRPTNFH